MAMQRVMFIFRNMNNGLLKTEKLSRENHFRSHLPITTQSGAVLPEPRKTRFGLVGVVCAVVIGLLIGATISKNVANFLEENDLFVPSDDDDDDD